MLDASSPLKTHLYLFPGAMNVTYVVMPAGVVINQGLLFAS